MRFYNQPHAFYVGVDLHARSMFPYVLDTHGATVFARGLPTQPFGLPARSHSNYAGLIFAFAAWHRKSRSPSGR